MKLIIASDIHGSAYWCEKLMRLVDNENPDYLLLLGDILYHGPRNDLPQGYAPKQVITMLSQIKDMIRCVRGNCEAEVDQMVLPFPCMADYAQLLVDGNDLFMSHGHLWNPGKLPPLKPNSIFLFGHTHIKMDTLVDGVRCLNPGSVSIPKDGTNSCLIYDRSAFRFHIFEE